jgi:hypothetical protein
MDLLPLYLSGEASADSRALIVAFLAQDPELAERIRAEPQDLFRDAAQPQLPADLEVRSLRRARRLINLQKWLFGPGIALSALSLAIVVKFDHGRVHGVHLLIGDYPRLVGTAAILAVVCWIAYYSVRHRLRSL